MENLEPILTQHPFLQGLDQKDFDLLVGCAMNVRFDADAMMCREGEEATQFFIIRSGRVTIELHVPGKGIVQIQTLSEGDILGWSWLFAPYRWRFDARATELTRAIALDGRCLRTKCEADRDLGYKLLKRFSEILEQRLEAMRLQLLDLYSTT
jgi:CRP-like cAMP-binding protein